MSKYTELTLKDLRANGYTCWMVEIYNQFTRRRTDLFNFADLIAIQKDEIVAVQSCGQDFKEHERKILANEYAPQWLDAGGIILLYGWNKRLKKNKDGKFGKLKVWYPRIREIIIDDYPGEWDIGR